MSAVGFPVTGNNFNSNFLVVKNEQNNLKGLVWASTAACLTGASLTLTGVTIGVIGGAILGQKYIGPGNVFFVAAAAATVDYLAIKFTGFCYNNAIYHFGPEYQIVRAK